jgi:hypothetical protein
MRAFCSQIAKHALAVAGLICAVGPAHAAAPDYTTPERLRADGSRSVGVKERAKPEYDAAGIRVGGGSFSPQFEVGLGHETNPTGAEVRKLEDSYFGLGVGGLYASDGHRVDVELRGQLAHRAYAENGDLDGTDLTLGGETSIDVGGDVVLSAAVGFDDVRESLLDAPEALALAAPVEFQTLGWSAKVERRFNRLTVTGAGGFETFDYDDARLASGGRLDQDARDRDVWKVGGQAKLGISPDTAAFASVSVNNRDFKDRSAAATQDSKGYEALLGVTADVSNVARGLAGLGVFRQEFEARGVEDVTSVSARGEIEWFPDPLVTVTVRGSRNFEDSGSASASSAVASQASVLVDYELRRNLVLSGGFDLRHRDFQAVSREDRQVGVGVDLEWRVARGANLLGRADFTRQDSSGAQRGRQFDAGRLTFGLRLAR